MVACLYDYVASLLCGLGAAYFFYRYIECYKQRQVNQHEITEDEQLSKNVWSAWKTQQEKEREKEREKSKPKVKEKSKEKPQEKLTILQKMKKAQVIAGKVANHIEPITAYGLPIPSLLSDCTFAKPLGCVNPQDMELEEP